MTHCWSGTASRDGRDISPGLIFNCQLQNLDIRNSTCRPIGLSSGDYGSYFGKVLIQRDFLRDDAWFGATIANVPSGKLVACAPRWSVPYKDKHILANGACYLLTQTRGIAMLPLKEMNRQAYKTDGNRKEFGDYGTHLNFYAYGQTGMSIKVTESNSVIIGAPGLLQWAGGIVDYKYDSDKDSMFISKQPTTNPYFTKEIGPDDYFGYSVESGVFGPDKKTLYVGGAPRSKFGYGEVFIFEPAYREYAPLKVIKSLRGRQLGSYFGASLCCMDINADGKLDLLVGAPNFVSKEGELRYDQGAVFVYLNSWQVIITRFGSTIVDMGDVDGDGYNDVAIGAPWENDGYGAVYIYRGGEKGIGSQYTQKIVAKGAKSFGISISKGFDVDSNNCSDLAVGAINSDTVYLYRCIPTIEVYASIKVPDVMNIPLNATNFTAIFCIEAKEQIKWPHVKTVLNAIIRVDPDGGRAWISGDAEYQVTIKPGNKACEEQTVQVKPTADLSKPITINFELSHRIILEDDSPLFLSKQARLSENSKLHSSFEIQLNRECGEDLICKPLLEMTLEGLSNPYIPGSENRFGIKVTVLNKDEPAYGAKVYLTIPTLPKRLPSECSLKQLNITCDVPPPLHRNESVTWEIEFEYVQNNSFINEINIEAVLEDPLHSNNDSDKVTRDLTIIVKPEASFNITGTVQPNKTISITRDALANGDSVAFVHYFEIKNLGPSDWYNLTAILLIPDKTDLSNSIDGCNQENISVHCSWSLPARASKAIALTYKLNVTLHANYLEEVTIFNATTTIILNEQNINSSLITSLVLDPPTPLWPLIVGIVAGILTLAVSVFGLHKLNFFERSKRDDMKRLQEEISSSSSLGELRDDDACTQDIQLEDSD
ncbi:PREDICTED: integrin alpha-9-like [Papilio polytes]|uniref:integrin alpha-9-like n=1 Tax=Papilio polytes TaxID=76194 RepID=UPI0006766664|nr:PREDICTED: integrin alpha-9-like [Papilio polytes]